MKLAKFIGSVIPKVVGLGVRIGGDVVMGFIEETKSQLPENTQERVKNLVEKASASTKNVDLVKTARVAKKGVAK